VAGARVVLVATSALGIVAVLSDALCEKGTGGLSFEEVAIMPCVFAMSIYSLFTIEIYE
jgi:hypothetical protein